MLWFWYFWMIRPVSSSVLNEFMRMNGTLHLSESGRGADAERTGQWLASGDLAGTDKRNSLAELRC